MLVCNLISRDWTWDSQELLLASLPNGSVRDPLSSVEEFIYYPHLPSAYTRINPHMCTYIHTYTQDQTNFSKRFHMAANSWTVVISDDSNVNKNRRKWEFICSTGQAQGYCGCSMMLTQRQAPPFNMKYHFHLVFLLMLLTSWLQDSCQGSSNMSIS